jgi:hypothetical protein
MLGVGQLKIWELVTNTNGQGHGSFPPDNLARTMEDPGVAGLQISLCARCSAALLPGVTASKRLPEGVNNEAEAKSSPPAARTLNA